MSVARAHVRIAGSVQGVGFRFATRGEANARGLAGWVRNLDSGEVEAVFEGPIDSVNQIVEWCREGPPGSWVRTVNVIHDEPPEGLVGFEIRPTGPGGSL